MFHKGTEIKLLAILTAMSMFVVIQGLTVRHPLLDVMKIRAVIGRDAIIPCGQKKIFLDGPEAYVSWMKNDKELIYRFPLNNNNQDGYSNSNEVCYKSPEAAPCRERTSLFLPHVSDSDSALYRCRIHYQASPSIDYSYQLIIVEKPGFPTVYDEDGNTMTNTFIGPIPLGANVTLICEVKDARENTVVYWEKEGDLLVPSSSVGSNLKRSVLRIVNATRGEHQSRYTCIAQAGDVTDPLRNTLEIRMYLPPLSIKINLNEKYDFEAGSPRVVDCIVIGSVPVPTIQWYLDDTRLNIYSHKESPGFNVTLSSMTFTPKRSDDNKILSCRATNHYFKEIFSSSVRLTVGYKPLCAQTLKQKLNIKSNKIEKVICFVDAVPPPIVFTWNFSDYKSVETPVEATDIPFRFKSVLSWIPHDEDIGKLSCRAVNYHGKQEEPCFFDLYNKVHDDCPGNKGCGYGIISGPPRLSTHTLTSESNNNGMQADEMHTKPVVVALVVIGLFLLVILTIRVAFAMGLCKRRGTNTDNSRKNIAHDEESTTYYPGVEIEQTCPVHSCATLYQDLPPDQGSSSGIEMTTKPKGIDKATNFHTSKGYSAHVFAKDEIKTFYI